MELRFRIITGVLVAVEGIYFSENAGRMSQRATNQIGNMAETKELPKPFNCPMCGRLPLTMRSGSGSERGYRTMCGIDEGDDAHVIGTHHAATKEESIEKWNRIVLKTTMLMGSQE